MATCSSSLSPARVFWGVTFGALLVQLAWVLASPAFRGMDEFDHAFRADSLVHGELLSRQPAEDGRGELVTVSEELASAARPVCEWYDYTLPDNCRPVSGEGTGRVRIASAAADYNPTYYVVAGMVARPFDGTAALMAMRLTTAALVAGLLGWASALLCRDDHTGGSLLGLGLVVTPVAAFAGGTAAPNAVGMGAGVLLWSGVVALLRRPERPPLVAMVVGVAVVANTHTTGVLWLAVTAVALIALRPLRFWLDWWWHRPWSRSLALVAAGMAVAAALTWIRWADTNGLNEPIPGQGRPGVLALLAQQCVWLLQTIAAFPDRTDPAPALAYLLWLVPLIALFLVARRSTDRGVARALLVLLVAWVLIPIVLTLISFRSEGFAWQGRYALTLATGMVLLVAEAAPHHRRPAWLRGPAPYVMLGTAHAVCAVSMAMRTDGQGTSFTAADAIPGAYALIACLAIGGVLLPVVLLRRSTTDGSGRSAPSLPILEAGARQ